MAFPIATWAQVRGIVRNVGGLPFPPSDGWTNNTVYLAGTAWLKPIEGNGLLKVSGISARPEAYFIENDTPPPPTFPDLFLFGALEEKYVEQLIGVTATTSSSSFTITADAFVDGGQEAGTGGTAPLSGIEYFEILT